VLTKKVSVTWLRKRSVASHLLCLSSLSFPYFSPSLFLSSLDILKENILCINWITALFFVLIFFLVNGLIAILKDQGLVQDLPVAMCLL